MLRICDWNWNKTRYHYINKSRYLGFHFNRFFQTNRNRNLTSISHKKNAFKFFKASLVFEIFDSKGWKKIWKIVRIPDKLDSSSPFMLSHNYVVSRPLHVLNIAIASFDISYIRACVCVYVQNVRYENLFLFYNLLNELKNIKNLLFLYIIKFRLYKVDCNYFTYRLAC